MKALLSAPLQLQMHKSISSMTPPLHDLLQPDGVEAEALVLGENSGISHIKVIPGDSLSFRVIPCDS